MSVDRLTPSNQFSTEIFMQAWLRVGRLTCAPREEWRRILSETSVAPLGTRIFLWPILLTLAVINACAAILFLAINQNSEIGSNWISLIVKFAGNAAFGFMLIAVTALVAWRLAKYFNALPDPTRAWSCAVYGSAPSFLALMIISVASIWPSSAGLMAFVWMLTVVLGLWSAYVFHLGLLALMRPPQSRAIPYTASVIATVVLIFVLLSLLTTCAAPLRMIPVLELPPSSGSGLPTAAGGTSKMNSSEMGQGGAGGTGAQLGGGGGEAAPVLPATPASAAGDPLNGVLHSGGVIPPKTVLERYLPGDVPGFSRKIAESYVLINRSADKSQSVLIDTAYAQAQYRAAGAAAWRSVSIKDLSTANGDRYADQLLGEIAQHGGESTREGGRVNRTVAELGARYVVTEYNATNQTSLYEVLIAKRYRLTAQAQGASLDELRAWIQSMDLVGLEARAKAGNSIE